MCWLSLLMVRCRLVFLLVVNCRCADWLLVWRCFLLFDCCGVVVCGLVFVVCCCLLCVVCCVLCVVCCLLIGV